MAGKIELVAPLDGVVTIQPEDTASNFTVTIPAVTSTLVNEDSDIEAQVKTATNATGDAPIFSCRAWCNFDGTGTVAIRASGNVSSITDNGTGDYTVNFTTALVDANYAPVGMGRHVNAISDRGFVVCFQNTADDGTSGRTTGSLRVSSHTNDSNLQDSPCVFVAIFR